MKDENINKLPTQPRILLAPLDWGLGHTTRCIPVIHALIRAGAQPILATEGASAHLLKIEFPNLEVLPLKGYRISYSKTKKGFFRKIGLQIPAIWRQIQHERHWLKRLVDEKRVDAVISDNRFGLYNSNIPCIYITHQLHLETGNDFFNKIAQAVHYRFINKFTSCWVPDHATGFALAGKLSHPVKMPGSLVEYLGPLSRFVPVQENKTIDISIILSGPEPQRSILEEKMLPFLKNTSENICLVRGLPGEILTLSGFPANVTIFAHLPANALNELICKSKMVVCRAGYSTIMDLYKLDQKAMLIPTPGQTEQEYLGNYLMEQGMFFCADQENFDMKAALAAAERFALKKAVHQKENLQEVVQAFVNSIRMPR